MAIAIYEVWKVEKGKSELFAVFTDYDAAQDFALTHNAIVCTDEAYDSVREYEAAQIF